MFASKAYTAVNKGVDLHIYSDSMRSLDAVFLNAAGNRQIIDTLYSQGLPAASSVAKSLGIQRDKR